MNKKWIIIAGLVLLFVAILAWLFVESSESLPGQKIADSSREHVPVGTKVDYNSNPPTSGNHYGDWVRAGIYESVQADGNLVHSLEHGYVIMSYNCDKKVVSRQSSVISEVYAHGIEEESSPSAQASISSAQSPNFRSADCHRLVDQLISIYEKKGKRKLIIVPRPNLDNSIALTAWTYLDKFDPSTRSARSGLSVSEMERIEKFIDAHRDQGPEKTKD